MAEPETHGSLTAGEAYQFAWYRLTAQLVSLHDSWIASSGTAVLPHLILLQAPRTTAAMLGRASAEASRNMASVTVEASAPVDSPFVSAAIKSGAPYSQLKATELDDDDLFMSPAAKGGVAESPFSRASAFALGRQTDSFKRKSSDSTRPLKRAGDPGLPSAMRASLPADTAAMMRRSASVPFKPPPIPAKAHSSCSLFSHSHL